MASVAPLIWTWSSADVGALINIVRWELGCELADILAAQRVVLIIAHLWVEILDLTLVSVFKGALGVKRIFRMKGSFAIEHFSQSSTNSVANIYAYFEFTFQYFGKHRKNARRNNRKRMNVTQKQLFPIRIYCDISLSIAIRMYDSLFIKNVIIYFSRNYLIVSFHWRKIHPTLSSRQIFFTDYPWLFV